MAGPEILAIRGLRKTYGDFVAVDDVDLTVGRGEIVGLVGKNGAGKSTLIKMVTGALTADAGEFRLDGVEMTGGGPAALRRHGIAVVHQELNVVRGLSVAENLALGAGYPRRARLLIDWRRLRRRAAESLHAVGLGDVDPRADVGDLSPVQQRLIMIAVALVHEPKVLILDEPTASFTDREVDLLHDTMRSLSARGTGVVFVSHRLDEVLSLTERVVVMRDGAVVAVRPTTGLTKSGLVDLITGGEVPDVPRTREADLLANPVALQVDQLRLAATDEPMSFVVRRGEILGIAGLVGSGRSELLRAVYGADPRAGGTVRVGDRVVRPGRPQDALAAGMALLSEDRRNQGLISSFSAAGNTTIASLRRHRWATGLPVPSRRAERRTVRRMMDTLAVAAPSPDAPVTALSGGNQQKVLMGRWLATEATVLLLDEPTVGVDVGAKADIQNHIIQLAEQGLAVVVVASEFAQLEELCHRVVVMAGGALGEEFVRPMITEPALLAACFGATEAAETAEAAS